VLRQGEFSIGTASDRRFDASVKSRIEYSNALAIDRDILKIDNSNQTANELVAEQPTAAAAPTEFECLEVTWHVPASWHG
jgi:hypothetical protein